MAEKDLLAHDIHAYLARHERKELLRFFTAGSVDDGKSTLIGRLLHDSKTLYEDHLDALKRDSARKSSAGGAIDYSLLVDGLISEREQGITIDVAYRFFSTEKRKFIIADTPGHEQYTRNMATGASTANLAIILVDARLGVLPQTKRHSFIATLLGIKHLIVAVNKMDLMGYAQEVFERIRGDFTDFAARLEVSDVHFIPISALQGDNVVERSAAMPWYEGMPLLRYLEAVHIASDRNLIDLRFPVQYVLRPDLTFRGFCGTVASGIVRQGDEVMALPSGRRSRVKRIVTRDGDLEEAFPPQAVTLVLEDEIDVSRGNMLVHVRNVPHREQELEAMVVWMHAEALRPGKTYLLKHTTQVIPATVQECRYRIDVNSLHRQSAEGLELNEIGRVALALNRPLFFDPYARNRATGSFVLIDRLNNSTMGAGMILDRQPNELVVSHKAAAAQNPAGLQAQKSQVAPEVRAQRLGQKAVTVWLTGLPKAGKSSLAYALEKKLFELGRLAYVLDGVNMRLGLSRDLGFSADDRSENSRRAAEVAKLCTHAGLITLAAFVAPYASDRTNARAIIGPERFIEVYLSAPVEVCETRDPEQYGKARRGELKNFTGITAPYEPPSAPDLALATHQLSLDECVQRVITLLRERGVIS